MTTPSEDYLKNSFSATQVRTFSPNKEQYLLFFDRETSSSEEKVKNIVSSMHRLGFTSAEIVVIKNSWDVVVNKSEIDSYVQAQAGALLQSSTAAQAAVSSLSPLNGVIEYLISKGYGSYSYSKGKSLEEGTEYTICIEEEIDREELETIVEDLRKVCSPSIEFRPEGKKRIIVLIRNNGS